MSSISGKVIEGAGVRKIGEPVLRKEDHRFITGQGEYSDDLNKDGQLYGFFVRSQVAHCIIKEIRIGAAKKLQGVKAVLTGKDFKGDGFGPIVHRAIEGAPEDWTKPMFDNSDIAIEFSQWPMPIEKVCHVGEPIAIVIAEKMSIAETGAGLVEVEFDELPPITDIIQAKTSTFPDINEFVPKNVAVHHIRGNTESTNLAMERADHVFTETINVPRLVSAQMEPRSGIGEYEPKNKKFIITAGNQGVHRYRDMIASSLKVESECVQVRCPDVGGGFGSRGHVGPEFVILAWAAKRMRRPVKWTSSRVEAFLSDWQGRDMLMTGHLGVDNEGKIESYKLEVCANIGAYTICYAPPANLSRLVTTNYNIPNASLDLKVYITNTVPVLPFRAAGRPETHLILERLIDIAALNLNLDPKQMRLKNLITEDLMPFKTAMGLTYDVGDYANALEMVASRLDYDNFEIRQQESVSKGRLRGISVVPFVETPVGSPIEMGRVELSESGEATIFAGTQNHGQGHETTYAQVLSDLLGIPFEDIHLAWGDTDILSKGGGTHSDRSMRMMGKVLVEISKDLINKAMPVASELLQVEEELLEFSQGSFKITGKDQEINIQEVAKIYPKFNKFNSPLMSEYFQEGRIKAYPYGASGAEVEIDRETGELNILRYSIVDDCGQAINPMIVHGQTHGGIVQGIGQAIGECAVFDKNTGQLLTGSFMDYMMPRADQFPMFDVDTIEKPNKTNELRIKAGGEAGTVPALAVISNAVLNALASLGINHFDMPYTASRIWQEIKKVS
ncbi:MAG: xanthine dehydrogenase family protein molybdopterin-binding subunit [Pseudomonadota bacterium]|nr:xanthine dehydrogenase family protein molybdopterin-binding subunit [Pseudomonadota bacterium]